MSEEIILNAEPRVRAGSNKSRVIRKIDGMVPAVIYGDEKDTLNIKLKLPILCVPSIYGEGFPRGIVEANTLSIPVISSQDSAKKIAFNDSL